MLYLIASPIGNLQDITFRALDILKKCDYVLCEDTRHSRNLLKHFDIDKPLCSYHKFNEASRMDKIIADLKEGKEIALLSDAGTPTIADPGHRLVVRCRQEDLPLTSIPGPCALVVALSLSGFDSERFQFVGFLPKTSGRRDKLLQAMLDYPGTSIAYETSHRLVKTLTQLVIMAPDCKVAVARELTKIYEECRIGTPKELLDHYLKKPPKGEIVLLLQEF